MNAKIYTGTKVIETSPALAAVLAVVFKPASAKASVSGEARDLAAIALANHIPTLGKFDRIELTDDDGVITIKAENLVNALGKVVDAYRTMEKVRESLAEHETLYGMVRSFVPANPSDGKRGRKAKDMETRYAL